jgi:tetratricopeptide (TPR) repeat protein
MWLCILLVLSVAAWGQQSSSSSNQSSSGSSSASSKDSAQSSESNSPQSQNPPDSQPSSSSSKDSAPQANSSAAKPHSPEFDPPRSDTVNAGDWGEAPGESSSKDTQVDLSAPDDAKPRAAAPSSNPAANSDVLKDEGTAASSDNGDVGEFHPWDPHKAAKDVEVGDFYFKRKNYKAAEERYREALYYKNNDALATYKLAICLEKLGLPNDALTEYENYMKILPHGPEVPEVQKAIARLSPAKTANSNGRER